jgi:Transposase and inactivated derivatives
VKAYVKRNKNDAADAEAICEAVRRPTMRFVQIKSVEQQGQLMLHRARDLLMRQRTQLINALRAHMAELGIVAAQGREGVKELLKIIASEQDARLPVDAHYEPSCVGGGASGTADDDWIDREADHCSASLGRSKQAAQEHPWDWHCGCDRHRRHCPGPEGFSIGS